MKKMIAIGVAVACLVPALALAARPAKDSTYRSCEKKNVCPLTFETTKNRRKIKDIRLYTDCAPVPVMDWGKIKVRRNGKFKKSGTVTDAIDQELKYTIKGRFKTRKKAVGRYDVDRADCSDDPHRFVAKRIGKAQAGF